MKTIAAVFLLICSIKMRSTEADKSKEEAVEAMSLMMEIKKNAQLELHMTQPC